MKIVAKGFFLAGKGRITHLKPIIKEKVLSWLFPWPIIFHGDSEVTPNLTYLELYSSQSMFIVWFGGLGITLWVKWVVLARFRVTLVIKLSKNLLVILSFTSGQIHIWVRELNTSFWQFLSLNISIFFILASVLCLFLFL